MDASGGATQPKKRRKRRTSPPTGAPPTPPRPEFSFWRALAHVIVAVIIVLVVGVAAAELAGSSERAKHLGRMFAALTKLVAMFTFGLSWFLQTKRRRGALIDSAAWILALTVIWVTDG